MPASKSSIFKSFNFNQLESFSSSAAMSGNKRVFFDVEASGEKLGKIVMEVRGLLCNFWVESKTSFLGPKMDEFVG